MSRLVSLPESTFQFACPVEMIVRLILPHLQRPIPSFYALPHVPSSSTLPALAELQPLIPPARLQTHLLQAVSGTVQFEMQVWIDLKREVERVLGTR